MSGLVKNDPSHYDFFDSGLGLTSDTKQETPTYVAV